MAEEIYKPEDRQEWERKYAFYQRTGRNLKTGGMADMRYLVIDLGSSSGKIYLARYSEGRKMEMEEIDHF